MKTFSQSDLRLFHICLSITLEIEYIDPEELETRLRASAESIGKLRTTIGLLMIQPFHSTPGEFSHEDLVTVYSSFNEVMYGIIISDHTLESNYQVTRSEVEELMKMVKVELVSL